MFGFIHFTAQESGSSLTVIAAVAGVLGVVVLALITALVVLYKRFHSPHQAGRVVYTTASNDESKMLVWERMGWRNVAH